MCKSNQSGLQLPSDVAETRGILSKTRVNYLVLRSARTFSEGSALLLSWQLCCAQWNILRAHLPQDLSIYYLQLDTLLTVWTLIIHLAYSACLIFFLDVLTKLLQKWNKWSLSFHFFFFNPVLVGCSLSLATAGVESLDGCSCASGPEQWMLSSASRMIHEEGLLWDCYN